MVLQLGAGCSHTEVTPAVSCADLPVLGLSKGAATLHGASLSQGPPLAQPLLQNPPRLHKPHTV